MFTQQERGQIALVIDRMSQYYGRKFEKEVISMMIDDLADLSAHAVLAAYEGYRRDPRSKSFPLPAQIRDMVSPQINPDAEARELLGRVKTAIRQFGWPQGQAARTYIGEVAWRLVEDQGGWSALCSSDFLTNDSMQAQARNRLVDLVHFGPRLSLVVDNKNQVSHEERIQLESARQKEEYAQRVIESENRKPDPNAEYLAKSPEERQAVIQNFLTNIKKV